RESAEVDTLPELEVEGEIREFVRRDVVGIRRQPESDSELVANNINQLLGRVAGTSVQEIDRLITELQTLRDTLQSEAARVQREDPVAGTHIPEAVVMGSRFRGNDNGLNQSDSTH